MRARAVFLKHKTWTCKVLVWTRPPNTVGSRSSSLGLWCRPVLRTSQVSVRLAPDPHLLLELGVLENWFRSRSKKWTPGAGEDQQGEAVSSDASLFPISCSSSVLEKFCSEFWSLSSSGENRNMEAVTAEQHRWGLKACSSLNMWWLTGC